jgi:DNA-binding NarL/FixJ family response regulator
VQILIADEQALLRDALRTLVEERGHEVVAEAASAPEAVELALRHEPAVVLLDLDADRVATIAATRRISTELASIAVVILSSRAEGDMLLEAVRAGARGFLTKDVDGPTFCTMLERAHAGDLAIAPHAPVHALENDVHVGLGRRSTPSAETLTAREREVLDHMTRGRTSNRELAETLGLSENTVRFHVRNILEKLHLHTRAAAVAHALTHRLGSIRDGR